MSIHLRAASVFIPRMCSWVCSWTFLLTQTFGTEEDSGALVGVVEMVFGGTVVVVVVVLVVLKVAEREGCVVKAGYNCKGGGSKAPQLTRNCPEPHQLPSGQNIYKNFRVGFRQILKEVFAGESYGHWRLVVFVWKKAKMRCTTLRHVANLHNFALHLCLEWLWIFCICHGTVCLSTFGGGGGGGGGLPSHLQGARQLGAEVPGDYYEGEIWWLWGTRWPWITPLCTTQGSPQSKPIRQMRWWPTAQTGKTLWVPNAAEGTKSQLVFAVWTKHGFHTLLLPQKKYFVLFQDILGISFSGPNLDHSEILKANVKNICTELVQGWFGTPNWGLTTDMGPESHRYENKIQIQKTTKTKYRCTQYK